MRLTFGVSLPTFVLIRAAPSCALAPSNIFIFVPVRDESLHATPTNAIRQSAPIGARSLSFEFESNMRAFLSTDALGTREYITRSSEAEYLIVASVRYFLQPTVDRISR